MFDPCKTVVLGKSQSFWLPEMPLKNKSEIIEPRECCENGNEKEGQRVSIVIREVSKFH